MTAAKHQRTWLSLVCDDAGATLCAVQGNTRDAVLRARTCIEWDRETLHKRGVSSELEAFVAEQQLRGADAFVAFAGAGSIAQRLTMPPLSAKNRERAVRTRLSSYAGGRDLVTDIQVLKNRPQRDNKSTDVLACGVDSRLARGLLRAGRKAGLRMRRMTALASAIGPPDGAKVSIQLLLGQRTSTVQLFDEYGLMDCRDVLLGRQDFVAAYQRPILTSDGPLTLDQAQAEALLTEVGIPVGREDEVRPGIAAAQLWPTLNPPLQKLQRELEQSLSQHETLAGEEIIVQVLAAPAIPGLSEFLAEQLELRAPSTPDNQIESRFLEALGESNVDSAGIDLRPPEERLGAKLTRPAMAVGLCALVVIFGNASVPRQAHAAVSVLRPTVQRLELQLEHANLHRSFAEEKWAESALEMGRRAKLRSVCPAPTPAVGLMKLVLEAVPENVQLEDVSMRVSVERVIFDVRGTYQGRVPASVVADQWARELSAGPVCADAKVTSVNGSGRLAPASMQLTIRYTGG